MPTEPNKTTSIRLDPTTTTKINDLEDSFPTLSRNQLVSLGIRLLHQHVYQQEDDDLVWSAIMGKVLDGSARKKKT